METARWRRTSLEVCTEAAGGVPQPAARTRSCALALGSARDAVSEGIYWIGRGDVHRRGESGGQELSRAAAARCSRQLLIAPGATARLQSCRRPACRCVGKALVSKPGGVLRSVRREQDECHEALKVTSRPPTGANAALEQRQQRHRQHDAAVDHAPCQVCRSC